MHFVPKTLSALLATPPGSAPKPQHKRDADPDARSHFIGPKYLPDVNKLQGWAPAISADPRTPFWQNSPGVEADLSTPQHGALSLADIETRWPRVGQAIREERLTWPRYASQVLAGQRGPTFDMPTFDNITPVTENAPNTPNSFSDGSAIRPNDPVTAIGTFAVWHPERLSPPDLNEFSVIEHSQQNQLGVSLLACLGGQAISSTRTEVAG